MIIEQHYPPQDNDYTTFHGEFDLYNHIDQNCQYPSIRGRLELSGMAHACFELYSGSGLILQLARYVSGTGEWTEPQLIPAGKYRWSLALRYTGIIDNAADDLLSRIELEIRNEPVRWLAGDLHQHTSQSDGQLAKTGLTELNITQGLDYMAITDHQIFTPGTTFNKLLLLSGIEITTPAGHLNIIGRDRSLKLLTGTDKTLRFGTYAWLEKLALNLKNEDCLVIINHPGFKPWHWRYEKLLTEGWFDALEIICDPSHPGSAEASEKAMNIWFKLLNSGVRVWGTGGSDYHAGNGRPGLPTTYIGCVGSDISAADILHSARQGIISVGCGYRPELKIKFNDKQIIDEIRVSLYPDRAEPGYEVTVAQLIYQGKVICDLKLADTISASIPQNVIAEINKSKTDNQSWLCAVCRSEAGYLTGFTNPVFINGNLLQEEKISI